MHPRSPFQVSEQFFYHFSILGISIQELGLATARITMRPVLSIGVAARMAEDREVILSDCLLSVLDDAMKNRMRDLYRHRRIYYAPKKRQVAPSCLRHGECLAT